MEVMMIYIGTQVEHRSWDTVVGVPWSSLQLSVYIQQCCALLQLCVWLVFFFGGGPFCR